MHDYSHLPTLVLNEVFSYLSFKDRLKCKAVCRSWREEIKLRDQNRDTLILHFGPYLWNVRWSQTNNRRLMKFENSFQVKNPAILEHPLAIELLEKTKKLALVSFSRLEAEISTTFIGHYLKYCEELEIRSFFPETTLTFDLPKLKVLVINECPADRLVLNCPSLEVLSWNRQAAEIELQNVKNLKRLIAFGWPVKVSFEGKLDHLEYFNLFLPDEAFIGNRILYLMPKLKRLVIYSSHPQVDLQQIRLQQKLLGLTDLEVLFSGFRDPVQISLQHESVRLDRCIDQLFENYPKLVENSPWKVAIDYAQLFGKFKILPGDFFERFREPFGIEISAVTNYVHLYEFLKCYPFVQRLIIHFSKVNADRIMDMVHLIQESLSELTIVEERPSHLLQIDLSFIRRFRLTALGLESAGFPADFIRKVAVQRTSHLRAIVLEGTTASRHQLLVHFTEQGSFFLSDDTCAISTPEFPSIELLIAYMRSHPHLNEFCC